jgi:hypothetical protein
MTYRKPIVQRKLPLFKGFAVYNLVLPQLQPSSAEGNLLKGAEKPKTE